MACPYIQCGIIQDDDECESPWGVCPPVKSSSHGLFEEGAQQLGYLLTPLWSSWNQRILLAEGFWIGIVAWGNQYERSPRDDNALGSPITSSSLNFALVYSTLPSAI